MIPRGEPDFSRFRSPEVPMSVAEYKEQKAQSSGNVRQDAGSAAVSSGSNGSVDNPQLLRVPCEKAFDLLGGIHLTVLQLVQATWISH